MHPAARILLVCGWAGAVELAAPRALVALAVLPALMLVSRPGRAAFFRLARRSRWLFAVLILTYAWTLPGTALVPALGAASPSLAGLEAGGLRVVRLLLILSGVAALLAYTAPARLVGGLYRLVTPFARLGLDPRAFAVRLGLTLDTAQARPSGADWRARLFEEDGGVPAIYRVEFEAWRARDGLALIVVVALITTLA